MKKFKVFVHPIGEVQIIKQGWCWPAFFFGFFWAIFVKMWAVGFGILIALFVFILAFDLPGAADGENILINIISIAITMAFGFNGNSWRTKNLHSRGFELKYTIIAANKDEAMALFIKSSKTVMN